MFTYRLLIMAMGEVQNVECCLCDLYPGLARHFCPPSISVIYRPLAVCRYEGSSLLFAGWRSRARKVVSKNGVPSWPFLIASSFKLAPRLPVYFFVIATGGGIAGIDDGFIDAIVSSASADATVGSVSAGFVLEKLGHTVATFFFTTVGARLPYCWQWCCPHDCRTDRCLNHFNTNHDCLYI